MQLTDEQKLEMTETIARACGWPFRSITNQPQIDVGVWIPFSPFTDWNDAMRAADALGVDHIHQTKYGGHNGWWTVLRLSKLMLDENRFDATHPDRLTAFCMALHEIAKAKLEEE